MYANIKEIDASELAQWVNDAAHELRVIDVRQMREISMGTVPGGTPAVAHAACKVHELSREEKLVMVCRSGARSAQACMFLQQQGFSMCITCAAE